MTPNPRFEGRLLVSCITSLLSLSFVFYLTFCSVCVGGTTLNTLGSECGCPVLRCSVIHRTQAVLKMTEQLREMSSPLHVVRLGSSYVYVWLVKALGGFYDFLYLDHVYFTRLLSHFGQLGHI